MRPFKLLQEQPETQTALAVLANNGYIVSNDSNNAILSFISRMYGSKPNTSLNDWRYQKFIFAYGPKGHGKNLLANLRGIDGSSLPPCEAEANAHIKRASFVAHIWASAHENQINQQPTEENGWELVDGQYRPVWFMAEQLPESLVPEKEAMEEIENEAEEDMTRASSDEELSSGGDE